MTAKWACSHSARLRTHKCARTRTKADDNDVVVAETFLPRCMECRRDLAMKILPVCPSVKRVDCDKTEERSVQIFIPYERYHLT